MKELDLVDRPTGHKPSGQTQKSECCRGDRLNKESGCSKHIVLSPELLESRKVKVGS